MADIIDRLRGLADVFEAQQAPHNLVLHLRAGADEIERLRAGGCARDQGTTQYCAEAAKLAAENERLRAALADPAVVHINMLAGVIAKPSPAQIIHIYGEDALRAALEVK